MRALLAITLVVVVSGSSGRTSSPVFRRADGSVISFPGPVRAWCDEQGLNVVSLGTIRQSRWQLELARRDLRPGRAVRFTWQHANGVGAFVFDAKTRNEASEGPEGSHGTVTVREAACRRGGPLEIAFTGTLASEFSDGKPVRGSGTYRGSVGPPPR